MSYEGVVFDLDATLVNLGGYVDWRSAKEGVVTAYLACGCDEEEVQRCSAKGLFNMLELMWEELNATMTPEDALRVQGEAYGVLDSYEALGAADCSMMPGCLETLIWLQERGVPMGICTSNAPEAAEMVLEETGIRHFFDSVVGRTLGRRMKPHPDQLIACFSELGVEPRRGVMVGDSHRDVLAGRAAGSYTIAVPAYFSNLEAIREAGADKVVKDLHELPRVFSELGF